MKMSNNFRKFFYCEFEWGQKMSYSDFRRELRKLSDKELSELWREARKYEDNLPALYREWYDSENLFDFDYNGKKELIVELIEEIDDEWSYR